MEVQLGELIEQIKKEGVEAAEAEAEKIVNAARNESENIIAQAKEHAEKILSEAKAETERMRKSSEDAIRQAGRNLLISFRESVIRELKTLIEENVADVYSSDDLGRIIISAVDNWTEKPDAEDIEVILNDEDLKRLEGALLTALKEKMTKGVTLKANDNFDGGFRVAVNSGSIYYDYSTEEVVNMLSNYLSPRVTGILKEAE